MSLKSCDFQDSTAFQSEVSTLTYAINTVVKIESESSTQRIPKATGGAVSLLHAHYFAWMDSRVHDLDDLEGIAHLHAHLCDGE
jgi:hypothetical protein